MDNHFLWTWFQEAVLTLSDNLTSIEGAIIFNNYSHIDNEIVPGGAVVSQKTKNGPHCELIKSKDCPNFTALANIS